MRLLFVCVGNTCRSQMAEALAKHKGYEAQSAGTSPGSAVAPEAIEAIGEKGIDMGGQYPKSVDDIDGTGFDRIISMGCGVECPALPMDRDWGLDDPDPSRLYVRAPVNTRLVAQEIPTVVSLGGPDGANASVPTDLLDAQSQVDGSLNNLTKMMGGLALVVGGVGIANVMSISVIQRSTEIGIRRALGHSRGTIAMQFLFEALVVGVLGGIIGAAAGAAAGRVHATPSQEACMYCRVASICPVAIRGDPR